VRSLILFSRNYQDREQMTELCRAIKSLAPDGESILVSVDHEGGRVQRFLKDFTPIPSMREVGARGDDKLARDLGRTMARELRSCNIDLDFAPVLDVDSNPANPVIGERSFGGDPQLVARLGCAMIDGLQGAPDIANRVAACGKHFPGHGDTSTDSHFDLPRLPHDVARLRAVELVPFFAAAKAGVASIMTAHVMFDAIDPEVPATMSRIAIDDILRKRLGFDGVVISDDLEMKAIADHFGIEESAVRAAAAGVDLILCCHTPQRLNAVIDALALAAENGSLPTERIEQSHRRLARLHSQYVTA
jgi:beta-N-acetylhexosaminidase